ncbi:hypothetical protein ACH5RR_010062 [Cinchona calisaya]|uniref:Uncharacterized protein n=1 Tax=Cinchona calisaya TaxID=153742 RepID=A0ABD3AI56_9GENT
MAPRRRTSPMASTKINLKLLVDKSSKRVLFAEAGKDFVDFLFGLLELPLGCILSHLAKREHVRSWSIGKVYQTVQNLDPDYFQRNTTTKTSLLKPTFFSSSETKQNPLLKKFGSSTTIKQQQEYSTQTQDQSSPFQFPNPTTAAPSSGSAFDSASSSGSAFGSPSSSSSLFNSSAPSSSSSLFHFSTPQPGFGASMIIQEDPSFVSHQVEGYVKGMMTYMVMNDLTVKPMLASQALLHSTLFISGMWDVLKRKQSNLTSKWL